MENYYSNLISIYFLFFRQMFTLPELTPEGYRVNICIFVEPDADKYNLNAAIKRALNSADVRLMSDRYQGGEYFVYDLKCVSLMHFTKITPVYMKKVLHCAEVNLNVHHYILVK